MSRGRSKISRIIAIVGLSVLVASATVPCAAWAKGGDQSNGNGGGNGNGHDNNGNGNGGNGHDNNGNGGGNGNGGNGNGNGGGGHGGGPAGGAAAGGGPAGGGAANAGGASANGGGGGGAPGNGGGGASGGNGNGNGGGGANSGGASTNSGGGVQANTAAALGGAAGTADRFGGAEHLLASNAMLGRAVVALNATMAAPRPPAQAGPDLRIQQMATYDRAMLRALAMPDRTPAHQAARNRAIAGARIQLAVATHRRLNPAAITRVDALLGLPPSDPTLGVQ
jgi:hypothetical protein